MLSILKNLSGVQVGTSSANNVIAFSFNTLCTNGNPDTKCEILIDEDTTQVLSTKVIGMDVYCRDIVDIANELKDLRILVNELRFRIMKYVNREKETALLKSKYSFFFLFFFFFFFLFQKKKSGKKKKGTIA